MASRKFCKLLVPVGAFGVGALKANQWVNDRQLNFHHPAYLFTLPYSIVSDPVTKLSTTHQFKDPLRALLNEKCANASWFDRMTIPPVNATLDRDKVPLTKDAFNALLRDMESTMKPIDSEEALKLHMKGIVLRQGEIAEAFHKSDEDEGYVLHSVVKGVFGISKVVVHHALHESSKMDEDPGYEPPEAY